MSYSELVSVYGDIERLGKYVSANKINVFVNLPDKRSLFYREGWMDVVGTYIIGERPPSELSKEDAQRFTGRVTKMLAFSRTVMEYWKPMADAFRQIFILDNVVDDLASLYLVVEMTKSPVKCKKQALNEAFKNPQFRMSYRSFLHDYKLKVSEIQKDWNLPFSL